MITANSYIFSNTEENHDEKNKFNMGPIIFGAVALVSHFYVGSSIETPIVSLDVSANSIQYFNITTHDEETSNYSLHNNQSDDLDSSAALNFKNDDILNIDADNEMEVLDVEELRRLQQSFDSFSDKNHETQLEMTKTLATLTNQMESVNKELARLNKTQENLPENIKNELAKIQVEKSDNNKNVWIAPIITGITVAVVGSLIIYFMGIG